MPKSKSIYHTTGRTAKEKRSVKSQTENLLLHQTVRKLRQAQGMTGIALCRKARDLDSRTLTALEKGRIVNPSIKTLRSVARGLGITVGELFLQSEMETEENFCLGSQKGNFCIDFPQKGVRIISYTPRIRDFFCGKLILAPRIRVDDQMLRHKAPLFVSVLIGRFEIVVAGRRCLLKEGENLFFNGALRHSFYNSLHRESALWIITAPSFLS